MKKSNRKGRFILLVGSDHKKLSYLSVLLKRFEYQTYMVKTAGEVIELVASAMPSLIIMFLDLKDIDSLKLMQGLKKKPDIAGIPFFTLIEEGDAAAEKRCFLYGATECFSLSISPDQLFQLVQRAVEETPRSHIRIRMLLPVRLTSSLGETYRTCMLDLSERGMFLACENPSAVNTRISLLINLNGRLIPVEALVHAASSNDEGPYLQAGMGLEFVKIKAEDQDAIHQFILDDIMRGIDPV